MKTLTILFTIFLISSCAFHSGTITSNLTDTPVVHKEIAVGVSSANVILGFGGLKKHALVSKARKNMIIARPLENNEQYNNVEVNIKRTYYGFGLKTKVVITADVIEPKDSVSQATYSELYLSQIQTATPELFVFSVGDSVFMNNYNYQSGRVINVFGGESKGEIEIAYTDENGKAKTKTVVSKRVFMVKQKHRGLELGERLGEGVILAFGKSRVLIKAMYGITTWQYPK